MYRALKMSTDHYGPKVDIWSARITLYSELIGRNPCTSDEFFTKAPQSWCCFCLKIPRGHTSLQVQKI